MTTPKTTSHKRWMQSLIVALAICAFATNGCTSSDKSSDDVQFEDIAQEELGADDEALSDQAAVDGDLDSADAPTDDLSDDLAAEELGEDGGQAPSQAVADSAPVEDLTLPEPDLGAPISEPPPLAAAPEAPAQTEPAFAGNFAETSISNIKYVARKGGAVVIETSSPATYHTREVPAQSQVIIEIANAVLPERLKRPYVTKDFNQSISSINAYQDAGSSTVRVVVQFRGPTHADVKQDGTNLMLVASGEFDTDGNMLGENVADAEAGSSGDARILPSTSVDASNYDNIKFYGKPISIEVRDTPVRDVINLIAEQSGANIVLSGEVEGNISLKLRQIPWDQALLIVMKSRNLGYVRQGSILRIAPYEALEKETESARKVADAQKAAEPLRVRVIPVGYAKVDGMATQITPFLTKDRGHVVADVRTNALLVTDTPDVLERVANLVKALDLPPLQVLIEGKVVEAAESFERNFGVRWGYSGQDVALGDRSFSNSFASGITAPAPTQAALNFRIGAFDVFGDINARLGLAEAQDQVKIISSPRVVAVNNEQATITQSNNIPIRTLSQVNGSVVTTVTYKEVPLKLDVTPQVTSQNDVIMTVNIKRDFAANRSEGIDPDINSREAKTKVLVKNGQTAVIGGVYQSDTTQNEQGVPWIRHVPVLGWLFKNKTDTNNKNELLVFLTPRILNAEKSIQKESTL